MKLSDINRVSRNQIQQAGARYTPCLDPNAPNIEIRQLDLCFAALGGEQSAIAHVRGLEAQVRDAIRWMPKVVKRTFRRRKFTPERVADWLDGLARSPIDNRQHCVTELSRGVIRVERALSAAQNALYEQESAAGTDKERQEIRSQLHDVRRVLSPIREVEEFVESPAFALFNKNAMILLGTWGTGKTHSLCDLAERRMKEGLPTLLQLAHSLPYQGDPLQALCESTGLAPTPTELLQGLQQLGEDKNSRALLIIDAINEGNRDQWRHRLLSVVRAVGPLKNVAILVSCRQPFERLILTEASRRHLIGVEHHGFAEVEVDAQVAFFTYYDIPAPHVPLLTPEFSNPLFLKMLCESIRNRSRRSKSRYVRDLASGQKGMTRVLEWADPHGAAVRDALPRLARELLVRLLLPRGKNRTTHALMQDYALGIIDLASRLDPHLVTRAEAAHLSKPLRSIRSRFPSPNKLDDNVEEVKSALHMDFENYTIGRLVRQRGNYDFHHEVYRGVRRQILWRVADLGYSVERFAAIDREIAHSRPDYDPARVDRYGKKYSWIAFFEMYGVRRAGKGLAELSEDRPSDVDIDPALLRSRALGGQPRVGF